MQGESYRIDLMRAEIQSLKDKYELVNDMANKAVFDISMHEGVCAERYLNIQSKLGNLPKIFDKIEAVQRLVNIGVGGVLLASGGFIAFTISVIVYISKLN